MSFHHGEHGSPPVAPGRTFINGPPSAMQTPSSAQRVGGSFQTYPQGVGAGRPYQAVNTARAGYMPGVAAAGSYAQAAAQQQQEQQQQQQQQKSPAPHRQQPLPPQSLQYQQQKPQQYQQPYQQQYQPQQQHIAQRQQPRPQPPPPQQIHVPPRAVGQHMHPIPGDTSAYDTGVFVPREATSPRAQQTQQSSRLPSQSYMPGGVGLAAPVAAKPGANNPPQQHPQHQQQNQQQQQQQQQLSPSPSDIHSKLPPPPRLSSKPTAHPPPRPGGIQVNIPLVKTPVSAQPGSRSSATGGIAKPSSVTRSPALKSATIARSPTVGTQASLRSPALKSIGIARSPTVGPHSSFDHSSLLIHVADELLSTAMDGSLRVANAPSPDHVETYHRLVATGLACLEAAITSNRLPPRLEVRTRLRYAAIVVEETEELMDAETMLTQGIALAEKHLFTDLKYCMQYVLMKVLFRRGPKAAIVALDKTISECNTFNHVQWSYTFRFLKATFLFQSNNPADMPATVENLKAIATLAGRRGDYALHAFASLLEGLAHLRQDKPDTVLRVQSCISQASKFQLQSESLGQAEVLSHLLNLACSLRERNPDASVGKTRALSDCMTNYFMSEDGQWNSAELLLPVRKEPSASATVSKDTHAMVRKGDGDNDFVVLTFLSNDIDVPALMFGLKGIAMHYKNPPGTSDQITGFWNDAQIELAKKPLRQLPRGSQVSLQQAMRLNKWSSEYACYTYVLWGMHAGTLGVWSRAQYCADRADEWVEETMDRVIVDLVWYLKGVCLQGRAKMAEALAVFSQERFALPPRDGASGNAGPSEVGPEGETPRVLALLAALNRLWIMQHDQHKDPALMEQLMERLGVECQDHPDPEVRTAWSLAMASMVTQPSQAISETKRYIQAGLKGAVSTRNTHCLSIALSIMRWRLFEGVLGDQALKSAKAASGQAKKVGNPLWMSVAEGMLAGSYAMQNQHEDYERTLNEAVAYANEAFFRSEQPPAA